MRQIRRFRGAGSTRVADDLQIGEQRLMLQMHAGHDGVVAHECASVQKHAHHGQKADPPAQHLQSRLFVHRLTLNQTQLAMRQADAA